MILDVTIDRHFEFTGAAVDTLPNLFFGNGREEALDEIQPRGACGRKVHVEARMPNQPASDGRRLVRPVIVHDQMHVQARRHVGVDLVEERAELFSAAVALTLPQHLARFHVQRGKQGRRAVAHIVMRPPLDLPRAHGQERLSVVQGLDLTFLVDAQYQGLVRRVHIQPDNIPDFFDEQRVARELERFTAVRLQREGAPNPTHGALARRGFGRRRRQERSQSPG